MTSEELKQRTKRFAVRIMKLGDAIPDSKSGKVIAWQIIRSGTSVGANYRAACRSKSDKDFLNKIIIVEEEADETAYWLEMLEEGGLLPQANLADLLAEAVELTKIFTATGRSVKARIEREAAAKNRKSAYSSTNYTTSNPESEVVNPGFCQGSPNPESEIRNPE